MGVVGNSLWKSENVDTETISTGRELQIGITRDEKKKYLRRLLWVGRTVSLNV